MNQADVHRKRGFVLVWVLFFAGCISQPDEHLHTENQVLNGLLQQGTITTIHLDSMPVDTVLARVGNIMGKERAASLTAPGVLDHAVDLAKIGDSLYVADSGQQCIWVMDNQGKWVRRIGRAGRGPGEFGILTGIDGNSKHIFTFDHSNARVQVYNHQFDLKTSFYHAATISGREIVVNDNAIFILEDYTEQNNLIGMFRASPPFDYTGSFWSPIVPYGKQPLTYNKYVITANDANRVALAFMGLPYVFILDSNQEVDRILYLNSSLWKEIKQENPSVRPVIQGSIQNIRVAAYILHLHLANDGDLYLRTRDAFYVLDADDGNYRLKKAIRFVTTEKIVPNSSGPIRVPSEAMDIQDDTVYFASGFTEYIYRFPLN